jgi:hypothetical protein
MEGDFGLLPYLDDRPKRSTTSWTILETSKAVHVVSKLLGSMDPLENIFKI